MIIITSTVEPPVSDHPRCEDLVVAYDRQSLMTGGRLQESNHRGIFQEDVWTHHLYGQ